MKIWDSVYIFTFDGNHRVIFTLDDRITQHWQFRTIWIPNKLHQKTLLNNFKPVNFLLNLPQINSRCLRWRRSVLLFVDVDTSQNFVRKTKRRILRWRKRNRIVTENRKKKVDCRTNSFVPHFSHSISTASVLQNCYVCLQGIFVVSYNHLKFYLKTLPKCQIRIQQFHVNKRRK